MKKLLKRFATFLASTVFALALLAGSASAITRNQAEGLANAQTSRDCGSYLRYCIYEDTSECHGTGVNISGHVQWWCTEVFAEQNKITGSVRYGSRALGYGPYGGNPLVAPSIDYQSEPVN